MPPMKKKVEGAKKEKITVEVKKEIIERHEQGMRVAEIARYYKKSTSTICTILKRKEEIKGLNAAKGVTRVSKQRPPILEDVEKLLLVWINERQLAGENVTENLVCEKAKVLYAELISKMPTTSTENEEGFLASRGWFDNFKRRSGIHSIVKHGEAASFRREMSKSGMGAGKKYNSTWFAYPAMHFLADRYKPRKNTDASEVSISQVEEEEADIENLQKDEVTDEGRLSDAFHNESNMEHETDEVPRTAKKRKLVEEALKLMQRVVAVGEKEADECKLYAEYVAEKLRKLDDRSRAIAIHKMNGTLFAAEMGQYRNTQPFSPSLQNESIEKVER